MFNVYIWVLYNLLSLQWRSVANLITNMFVTSSSSHFIFFSPPIFRVYHVFASCITINILKTFDEVWHMFIKSYYIYICGTSLCSIHIIIQTWTNNTRALTYKPNRQKTYFVLSNVRTAKIQISLRIRASWSESSQCAFWLAKDAKFLHADNKHSDQIAWVCKVIWVFVGRICYVVRFLKLRHIYFVTVFTHGCVQQCKVIANVLPCLPVQTGAGAQGKTLASDLQFWMQPR